MLSGWSEREVMYISLLGSLFLRMLKALILPLIIPSLIAAVGSLDMGLSKKVTIKSLLFEKNIYKKKENPVSEKKLPKLLEKMKANRRGVGGRREASTLR